MSFVPTLWRRLAGPPPPMVIGVLVSLLLPVSAIADGVAVTPGTSGTSQPECRSSACFPALTSEDREALGRVAYAEAGNQGAEGLAAVLYAVLNRLSSGGFGPSVEAVIGAPGQFEPVARVGGNWRNLPSLSAEQRASITTIIDLMQQGRLPDLTHGATSFQNPRIVAAREAARQVPTGLTNFGNQRPIAVVRDHAFFGQPGVSGRLAEDPGPHAHLVFAPGVTPAVQVERVNAGTPANPHAVMYRIIAVSGAPVARSEGKASR